MAYSNMTCPSPEMKATSNGVFQGDNPLHFALPLAILQICLVVLLTRLLAFLFQPLRQPRVIAEIIGGVLLGPSALGRNENYLEAVFPQRSLTVLDTLANLGLLFFLFLVGLELDLNSLRKTGKKALSIAIAGISLPFALGIGVSFVLRSTISKGVHGPPFILFMGVALSITAFPVLARILAELKLLTTDVGRMAMSAAAINDVAAWILLALAIALSGSTTSPVITLWVFLCGGGFVIFCTLCIPMIFTWIAPRTREGDQVDELYVCATLVLVLAAGFVTDAIGIHALFGAFVIGVAMPKEGQFASLLVEKVEDLVSGLFLPLYFVSSGLKTNVATIRGAQSWGLLVLIILTACFGKILGTVAVSIFFKVPIRESLALGILMNTKGLVELIVLNIGKDRKVLNDQTFAILVMMALFTTFITTPLVTAVYKPGKKTKESEYKYRSVERKNENEQLRILVCFQSTRNIPSMINLIEASRGTEKRSGLCVYAMHLMELSERSSAILMVHKARKNGLPFWNKAQQNLSNSNHIVIAFKAFQNLSRVSIRPMTAISHLTNVHEDICASAERKGVAMIIIPFYKDQRVDGTLETTRVEFRFVNHMVLEHAPCSVGLLVDRGIGGNAQVSSNNMSLSITVLFFGGRDDREAVAYGWRMAEHPGIKLVVVRFLRNYTGNSSTDGDNVADDEAFGEFRQRFSNDESVKYEDRVLEQAGLVDSMREFSRCDMFVVGRSPIVTGWNINESGNNCQELGPIGGILTAPDFATHASVLVVQQYHNYRESVTQD